MDDVSTVTRHVNNENTDVIGQVLGRFFRGRIVSVELVGSGVTRFYDVPANNVNGWWADGQYWFWTVRGEYGPIWEGLQDPVLEFTFIESVTGIPQGERLIRDGLPGKPLCVIADLLRSETGIKPASIRNNRCFNKKFHAAISDFQSGVPFNEMDAVYKKCGINVSLFTYLDPYFPMKTLGDLKGPSFSLAFTEGHVDRDFDWETKQKVETFGDLAQYGWYKLRESRVDNRDPNLIYRQVGGEEDYAIYERVNEQIESRRKDLSVSICVTNTGVLTLPRPIHYAKIANPGSAQVGDWITHDGSIVKVVYICSSEWIVIQLHGFEDFQEFRKRNFLDSFSENEPEYSLFVSNRNTLGFLLTIDKGEYEKKLENDSLFDVDAIFGYLQLFDLPDFRGFPISYGPLLATDRIVGEGHYVIEPMSPSLLTKYPRAMRELLCQPVLLFSAFIRYVERVYGLKLKITKGSWGAKTVANIFTEDEKQFKEYRYLTGNLLRCKSYEVLHSRKYSYEHAQRLAYEYSNYGGTRNIKISWKDGLTTAVIRTNKTSTYCHHGMTLLSGLIIAMCEQERVIGLPVIHYAVDGMKFEKSANCGPIMPNFKIKPIDPKKKVYTSDRYCHASPYNCDPRGFNQIWGDGDIFLTGEEGSGKSTMFIRHARWGLILVNATDRADRKNEELAEDGITHVRAITYQQLVEQIDNPFTKNPKIMKNRNYILNQVTDILLDEATMWTLEAIEKFRARFWYCRIWVAYGWGQLGMWRTPSSTLVNWDSYKSTFSCVVDCGENKRCKDPKLREIINPLRQYARSCNCDTDPLCVQRCMDVIQSRIIPLSKCKAVPGVVITRRLYNGKVVATKFYAVTTFCSSRDSLRGQLSKLNILSGHAVQGDDAKEEHYNILVNHSNCQYLYSAITRAAYLDDISLIRVDDADSNDDDDESEMELESA